jgi:hypothetical protein
VERRIAFVGLAVMTAGLWWFYARHLEPIWGAIAIGAMLAGGVAGVYACRRRWWLPLLPLPVFAVGGIALSFAFSRTHPFAGGGDWSAAAVVALAGVWFGLIATGVLLGVLAMRGSVHLIRRYASPLAPD